MGLFLERLVQIAAKRGKRHKIRAIMEGCGSFTAKRLHRKSHGWHELWRVPTLDNSELDPPKTPNIAKIRGEILERLVLFEFTVWCAAPRLDFSISDFLFWRFFAFLADDVLIFLVV
jgi:hypothetical protein